MRFLVSIENEILLFPVFGSFGKIFLLKMKIETQPNTFPSPFFIFSENKNKKQPNQTLPNLSTINENLFCLKNNSRNKMVEIAASL